MSEYAEQIGKSHQYVTQVRQAAEVLKAVKASSRLDALLNKTWRLVAVYAAPADIWALLVDALIADS